MPSSIHEVILIPDTLDMDIRYMKAMVKEVNGTEVAPDEVLSDNVYRYDIDTDRIEMMQVLFFCLFLRKRRILICLIRKK